jgi:hypothetical protein
MLPTQPQAGTVVDTSVASTGPLGLCTIAEPTLWPCAHKAMRLLARLSARRVCVAPQRRIMLHGVWRGYLMPQSSRAPLHVHQPLAGHEAAANRRLAATGTNQACSNKM